MDAPVALEPLCKAIDEGNLNEVKHTLSAAKSSLDIISSPTAQGLMSLALSIISHQIDIAEHLLQNGANVNDGYRAEWVDKDQPLCRNISSRYVHPFIMQLYWAIAI
jgi:hypothetical protein